MSLATRTTQLRAARKRGGGQAPTQQPTEQAAGHPSHVKGGEIKSLCCAAAGLIYALLSVTARLVYPTTCVRRAPKQSESLCSINRPHAQHVVGYKHLMQGIKTAAQAAGGKA
jgi:hypothetical protein